MQDFEKLGVFYLGREYDLASRTSKPELLLYDSKDLTTHAVCVGMTGSGKTGLCLALLEEAAIDGVPAIAIDPKGDLGNLLLTFPNLQPADFRPWIDDDEAARKGISPDELAAQTAKQWREGLATWGQDAARIDRFRSAAEAVIYTPGSSAGAPLAVLRSFAAPPQAIRDDSDALNERISAAVAGLFSLAGIDADPIRSREFILLSRVLEDAWRAGRDLDISGLIRGIQSPPFEVVGVIDLESFFPAKDRRELAMQLNNLLASPGFAGWIEGEPLDIGRLLYTPQGRPRLAIISIAHLSDKERMFFVTILLNEIVSWMRAQPGTSSLRAILYMDEIFGYFPPTANPPSKTPMLTLLKQARAYGLGVVLATQNPVDLDYKGLANTGTWFLGRLQTERDKARVLDGLAGAATASGTPFDRSKMDAAISGLGQRVFLMNNVHENEPVAFETRWCLSYLRGPLARSQIQTLMSPYKQARQTAVGAPPPAAPAAAATDISKSRGAASATERSRERPLVPPEAGECFAPDRSGTAAASPTIYRPALIGAAHVHYVDSKAAIDLVQEIMLIAPVGKELCDDVWEGSLLLAETARTFDGKPVDGARYEPLPAALLRAKNYALWQKALAAWIYRGQPLRLWRAEELRAISRPEESESDFRLRLSQRAREERDAAVDKLRQRYAPKIDAVQNELRRALAHVDREKSQFQGQLVQAAVSIGSTILNALVGRKRISATNVRGAATAARGAGRAASQRSDIGRAEADVEAARRKAAELETKLTAEVDQLDSAIAKIGLAEYLVRPRKSDIVIRRVALAWVPTG